MRPTCAISKRRRGRIRASGFTILEMLLVVIIIGVLSAITIPKIARQMQHERVNRAAQVVVQDLQNGFSIAGRQRAPVRLTFSPSALSYEFTDRATGVVLQTRLLSVGSEYSITSMVVKNSTTGVSLTTVDVLPNGIGSTAFKVQVAHGDYSRWVYASTAGFVRLDPQ
jgi:prepilin-type N-terminal cleavage/methylation domain-containing protein